MYCSSCGTQIHIEARFCNSCGNETKPSDVAIVSPKNDSVHNRDVVIIHLRTLRFLEIARERLRKNLETIDYKINNAGIHQVFYEPQRSGSYSDWTTGNILTAFGTGFAAFVVGILLNELVYWLFDSRVFMVLAFIGLAIGVVIGVYGIIKRIKDENKIDRQHATNIANTKKAMADDSVRVQLELQEKERLIVIRPKVYAEYQQVDNQLKHSYSVNIIPSQFRNLYAVYYLYEFLSTSDNTLSEALLHYDLDEIKRKLDIVIQQQEQIILNQELQISQNESLRKQNDDLIKYAIATETNTRMAAQYTEVAAANTEALMYMSVAHYIRGSF